MPCDYKNYPSDWKLRRKIVQQRAKNRCEICGLENHTMVLRDKLGVPWQSEDIESWEELQKYFEGQKPIKIVCTCAHWHNHKDHSLLNLKFLCQQCHNRHDAKMRAHHRRENREKEQLKLGD